MSSSSSARPETKEERDRRRSEKSRKVEAHRQDILRRVNKQAAAGLTKLHKREDFIINVEVAQTIKHRADGQLGSL